MARLERIVYRSSDASITDVVAYGPEEIRLDPASVAFVRSGYFARHANQACSLVDPNYVVFGGECESLLADTCKHICACTIIRYAAGAQTALPDAGCALASSHAFFLHAQLLKDARMRRSNPEAAVSNLFIEMRSSTSSASCMHSRVVTEIRRLLNESPSRRVPLEAIAGELYMSPFTVSRLFHRETGLRLRDYASRLRLRKALNMLLHSRKNLTSIAVYLGFYDESHFSKAFRAEFGVSPHSVRKY